MSLEVQALAIQYPCLSVRQPWAWAIIHAGKDIENRTWRAAPSYRGPLLIHAGKTPERDDWPTVAHLGGCIPPATMDLGGIVGIADLVDVVSSSASPWFFGPLGFVLARPRPLPFTPCKGKLGIFLASF